MKLPSDYLEQGWCQDSQARMLDGTPTCPSSEQAVQWCHIGAMNVAIEHQGLYAKYRGALRDVLEERHKTRSILVANDYLYNQYGQAQAVADAREAERRLGLRDV